MLFAGILDKVVRDASIEVISARGKIRARSGTTTGLSRAGRTRVDGAAVSPASSNSFTLGPTSRDDSFMARLVPTRFSRLVPTPPRIMDRLGAAPPG